MNPNDKKIKAIKDAINVLTSDKERKLRIEKRDGELYPLGGYDIDRFPLITAELIVSALYEIDPVTHFQPPEQIPNEKKAWAWCWPSNIFLGEDMYIKFSFNGKRSLNLISLHVHEFKCHYHDIHRNRY